MISPLTRSISRALSPPLSSSASAIIELRKMRQGLLAEELLPLAQGAFKVFTEFNEAKKRPSY